MSTYDEVPMEASQRRLIICTQNLRDLSKQFKLLPNLHTSGIAVVNINNVIKNTKGVLLLPDLIGNDCIVVQNPYDTRSYELIENAHETFALHKSLLISNVCQFLGASEYKVESIEEEKSENKTGVSGNVKGPIGSVDGQLRHQLVNAVKKGVKQECLFEGHSPDIQSAASFLDANNLLNEKPLTMLLTALSNRNNKMKSFNLETNLLREVNQTLQATASLNLTSYATKIKGELEMVKTYNFNLSHKFCILFP